jgi:uncharacterized protein (DUF2461 family)
VSARPSRLSDGDRHKRSPEGTSLSSPDDAVARPEARSGFWIIVVDDATIGSPERHETFETLAEATAAIDAARGNFQRAYGPFDIDPAF